MYEQIRKTYHVNLTATAKQLNVTIKPIRVLQISYISWAFLKGAGRENELKQANVYSTREKTMEERGDNAYVHKCHRIPTS